MFDVRRGLVHNVADLPPFRPCSSRWVLPLAARYALSPASLSVALAL